MSPKSLLVLAAGLLAGSLAATAQEKTPGYNYKIPDKVMTPDTVETRLGTLKFFDGMPDEATVEKLYDGLDIIRKILRQSRERLQQHGIVVLEVGGLRAAMDRAFPELDLHWLHTEDGEDCVCVIAAQKLRGGS